MSCFLLRRNECCSRSCHSNPSAALQTPLTPPSRSDANISMAEKWAVHVFNLGLRCKTIKYIQVKGSKATLRAILLKGFFLKHKYFNFNRTELRRNDTRVLFEMQSRGYIKHRVALQTHAAILKSALNTFCLSLFLAHQ